MLTLANCTKNWFKLSLLISSFVILLVGCGTGGTTGSAPDNQVVAPPVESPPPYWEIATPDFSDDPDRPVVTLNGDAVVFMSVGESYTELGATATDAQDGNLTSSIVIENTVSGNSVGDYFVRYQVTDSSQKDAIEAVRIVRVVESLPIDHSRRPVGSSQSHLGYFEHLPDDYGTDPDKKYPLLIYNHGNGANVEFSGDDPLRALDTLLQNAGPPLLLSGGRWDPALPFVVLAPQFGNVQNIDVPSRINAFVEYAINTYAVDESQIYFTGWSQGGFLSMLYAVEFPDRVAAVISVSGGIPADQASLPDNFCGVERVPVWAFHGDQDDIVNVSSSIQSLELIEANCQPTTVPRLTIFTGEDHNIQHEVFNLSAMQGGSDELATDPNYDPYNQSIYQWLLSFDLDDR